MFPKVEDVIGKSIVIASLNWGLGHVYRSCAIIRQLINQRNKITIACSKSQLPHFKNVLFELNIDFIMIEDYPFQFKGKGNWGLDLLFSYRKLKINLKKDMLNVEKIINEFHFDVLISDHRYGFYTSKIPSIFITHQIHLPLPWFAKFAQIIHSRFLKKFSQVWILDNEDSQLAGKLSVKNAQNQSYIGWFSPYYFTEKRKNEVILVIISGPSPYNYQFLLWAIKEYEKQQNIYILSTVLHKSIPNHWKIVNNSFQEMNQIYNDAELIVTRSGYSSIMDAKLLDKKNRMIPTPGQLEQIYLLELHKNSFK
jgi:UDP-N-acetylglucosamine:LPS N-acetylglucosamine transferase